ncbi:MAG: adenylate/guanylate cyclase domain-containing protein [Leptospiraceae bacterium]|nr:adenylate/guanylate cyclase domain-containing protein [Leptospiraceae bacterium]
MDKNILSTIESRFSWEILESEKTRVRILLIVMLFAFSFWCIAGTFFRSELYTIFQKEFPIKIVLSVLFFGICYESFSLFLYSHFLKNRKPVPDIARFANSFVETSLPSLVIYFMSNILESSLAFFSPLPFFYFIFITLSILRLNFGLSFFTGLVAGFELLGIALYQIPKFDSIAFGNQYFTSYTPIIIKSVVLLITGIIAGLVGKKVKKSLMLSIHILQEKNEIIGMFGQYVSPAVVDKLIQQKTTMPPEVKDVCIMFLDIRNFTTFSESRSPEEVIGYLNTIFHYFIDIVNQNGGMVNKFLGDGFLAVFGAPLSDNGKDVENAVKASIQLVNKLDILNDQNVIPHTKIGIGLHAGQAVTGNVGSNERKEYTLIGDTVNLASRVEQMNKEFGSRLLITDSVFKKLPNQEFWMPVPLVKVKGRKEEVQLYRFEPSL